MDKITLILSILCCLFIGQNQGSKIDDSLQLKLNNGQKNANIFVSFVSSPLAVIENISNGTYVNRSTLAVQLINALKDNAHTHQKAVQKVLNSHRILFKSYWISNQIYIRRCKANVISMLTNRNDVTGIQEEQILSINSARVRTQPILRANEWGVTAVGAPSVWPQTTGTGILVANIDTGVRGTHEALTNNYFGYWFDPVNDTPEPTDDNGHGTHTMGTAVGQNGIGVAPGAKWIACRGCEGGLDRCYGSSLLDCGEWIMCADGTSNGCQVIPNIVSNSWGSDVPTSFYDSTIAAWLAVNIFPVFANGNEGPWCGTTGSPARSSNVIAVGALDMNLLLAYSSSRSLSTLQAASPIVVYKPDVAAPGVNVRSAYNRADNAYATLSGTSMACPHVAGVLALVLSACPTFRTRYTDTKALLLQTSTRTGLGRPSVVCETENENNTNPLLYPNNEYGEGLVNALAAVASINSQCPSTN